MASALNSINASDSYQHLQQGTLSPVAFSIQSATSSEPTALSTSASVASASAPVFAMPAPKRASTLPARSLLSDSLSPKSTLMELINNGNIKNRENRGNIRHLINSDSTYKPTMEHLKTAWEQGKQLAFGVLYFFADDDIQKEFKKIAFGKNPKLAADIFCKAQEPGRGAASTESKAPAKVSRAASAALPVRPKRPPAFKTPENSLISAIITGDYLTAKSLLLQGKAKPTVFLLTTAYKYVTANKSENSIVDLLNFKAKGNDRLTEEFKKINDFHILMSAISSGNGVLVQNLLTTGKIKPTESHLKAAEAYDAVHKDSPGFQSILARMKAEG